MYTVVYAKMLKLTKKTLGFVIIFIIGGVSIGRGASRLPLPLSYAYDEVVGS